MVESTKEIQARIQYLKKTLNHADKLKKKEIMAEIGALQDSLMRKKEEKEVIEVDQILPGKSIEKSRQQKRREKKEEQTEALRLQALEDAKLIPNHHAEEMEKFKKILNDYKLVINDIKADGNCLFNSISDQLMLVYNIKMNDEELRRKAVDHISNNFEKYCCFIASEDGDQSSNLKDCFDMYCRRMNERGEWGGELEIQALSECLNVPIDVFQSDGSVISMGSCLKKEKLLISYHRHQFTLGAHYNSLRVEKE